MYDFPLMARHSAWVNAKLYDAVAGLDEADYRGDKGLFFQSVHQTLNHLLLVDRLWMGRITERQESFPSLKEELFADFEALREAQEAEDKRLIDLVDGLDGADLDQSITYRKMIGSGEETVQRRQMLLTLLNHKTHHRGQIHAVLTGAGINPGDWDVIFYLQEKGAP